MADAKIIELSEKIIAIVDKIEQLYAECKTIKDETHIERAARPLEAELKAAVACLSRLNPPQTRAGIKALACASLSCHADKDSKGVIRPTCEGHQMAIAVCKLLAT